MVRSDSFDSEIHLMAVGRVTLQLTEKVSTRLVDVLPNLMLMRHSKGRRSLEYRLRDAAQLKAETDALLASLANALNNCKFGALKISRKF